MSDTTQLEQQILADIAAASDEAALEAVRVAALGKSGSVSALLKTLGTMTPDERKQQGPLINGLKDRATAAIAETREGLHDQAPDAAPPRAAARGPAPAGRAPGGDRPDPPDQPGDRRAHGDLRRHGFRRRRGAGHRDRR